MHGSLLVEQGAPLFISLLQLLVKLGAVPLQSLRIFSKAAKDRHNS